MLYLTFYTNIIIILHSYYYNLADDPSCTQSVLLFNMRLYIYLTEISAIVTCYKVLENQFQAFLSHRTERQLNLLRQRCIAGLMTKAR